MGKSTLKIDRYCPLVIQVITANPVLWGWLLTSFILKSSWNDCFCSKHWYVFVGDEKPFQWGYSKFYPAPWATKYSCFTSEHIWKLFVGTVAKIFLNGASPQGCVSALHFLYITHIPKSDICILPVPSSKILWIRKHCECSTSQSISPLIIGRIDSSHMSHGVTFSSYKTSKPLWSCMVRPLRNFSEIQCPHRASAIYHSYYWRIKNSSRTSWNAWNLWLHRIFTISGAGLHSEYRNPRMPKQKQAINNQDIFAYMKLAYIYTKIFAMSSYLWQVELVFWTWSYFDFFRE